jgi:hypothetical protein
MIRQPPELSMKNLLFLTAGCPIFPLSKNQHWQGAFGALFRNINTSCDHRIEQSKLLVGAFACKSAPMSARTLPPLSNSLKAEPSRSSSIFQHLRMGLQEIWVQFGCESFAAMGRTWRACYPKITFHLPATCVQTNSWSRLSVVLVADGK